jgi:GT2 family glycosyltransferase
MTQPSLSLVLPTVGRSPFLRGALAALRADLASWGGVGELLVVAQGGAAGLEFPEADGVLRERRLLGFSAANNLGFGAARHELVGTVNDDAIVERGFCASLVALLAARPDAGAAQGLNVLGAEDGAPARVDGAGIGFNGWWQAVQIGHGEPWPAAALPGAPREIFGVSATAAIYRRSALEAVALEPGIYFDERLGMYYEDVDLAGRLRAAGYSAWLEPRARARHAGSASLATLPFAGRALIHGNRHLALARLLGRGYGGVAARAWLRDGIDLAKLAARGRLPSAWGVALGAGRAARLLGGYRHDGAATLPPEQLRAFPSTLAELA